MEVIPALELADETIWLFLLSVLAFLVTAFTSAMLLFRRSVPTPALVAGPLLAVSFTWLTSWLAVDRGALGSTDAVESVVVGVGTTQLAGVLFAMPTFGLAAVVLAASGVRHRPWNTRGALVTALLGFAMAGLVAFGAASHSGNPTFAYVRGVSYLLLTVLVVVAGLESIRPQEQKTGTGVAAAAAVLPVLWLSLAETSLWGFAHVLAPNQPQTLDAATCVELWPEAVTWLFDQVRAEVPWTIAAFVCAVAMAAVGAVRQLRVRNDVAFAVTAALCVAVAVGMWATSDLDQAYLLELSGLCPDA